MAKAKAVRKRATRTQRKPEGTAQPPRNDVVLDGTITLEVVGGPHDGKVIQADAFLLKLACEKLEAAHMLEIRNGNFVATVPFIRDVESALKDMGHPATPAIAAAFWRAVNARFIELQKKTND